MNDMHSVTAQADYPTVPSGPATLVDLTDRLMEHLDRLNEEVSKLGEMLYPVLEPSQRTMVAPHDDLPDEGSQSWMRCRLDALGRKIDQTRDVVGSLTERIHVGST